MQPVNVSPTFVSQDADLNLKESSSTAGGRSKSDAFYSLVDKHVSNKNKDISHKEAMSAKEVASAKNDGVIAANGNSDTNAKNSRQESDSSEQGSLKGGLSPDKASNVSTESENIEQGTQKKGSEDNEAFTESEQFISLLYNSDQTLTTTDEKALQNKQAELGISNNKQIDPVTNGKNLATDAITAQKVSEAGISENKLGIEKNSDAVTPEHKLKAFSKDEILARAQLKTDMKAGQLSGEQILKDYQQLLQSKQAVNENQGITSEQLVKSQLADAQLKNNKITNVAETVSQASKGLLKEQVDTGLYQLPVEPIGKGKPSTEGQTLPINELVAKVSEKQSEIKSNTLAKSQGESSAQLAAETNDDLVASAGKIASNSELKTEGKKDGSNLQATNAPLNKTNVDKMTAEQVTQSVVMNDKVSKEQPVDIQTKQAVMTNAQINALQQAQAQQKDQVINSEQHSLEETVDEYAYEDSMQSSQEKPKEQVTNSVSKVMDNTVRTAAELQTQTLQASQTKQNNDAYIEHQSSEVLNHNVVSDTAQIQKNNVQLQQETISIFKKDFADAVKDKVMVTINQKLQQFDITLDPPEFGNMQVRVNLQGEQAAVNFVVQNQQAKEALEQNMHKLREMLAEQGVDVGGASVEQQAQQKNNDGNESNQAHKNSSLLTSENEAEHNVEHVLSAKLFDSSATGVDYYA